MNNNSTVSEVLRNKAEEKIASGHIVSDTVPGRVDVRRLLHELEVYQVELEMQNEELRHAVAEKSAHEARLSDIIAQTPAGYFHINRDGYILDVNNAWLRIHGYESREEVVGKHFRMMQVDSESDSAITHLAELKRGGAIPYGEFASRRKDGTIGHHIFSAHPVVHAGDIVGFEWFIIDISERKQMEETLRYSEEQLQKALKLSEDTNSKMNRLLRVIVHEFRTPLGLLTFSTEHLNIHWDRMTTEKRNELSTHIQSASQQLVKMVNSLVSFNQLDTEQYKQPAQALDIENICRRIADEINSAWSTGQRFIVSVDEKCGTALLDEILFRRILENLLINAFNFTPPDGTVSLSVLRKKSRLCMVISDTGIGIPEKDQAVMLNPFFRGSNVGGRRGLGLGLSIVQDALTEMDGTITISSRTGEGTTVNVEISV